MFESIIDTVEKKLGIKNDVASSLLAALLGYMTSSDTGGIKGFLDKFTSAGLATKVDSWVGGATSEPISADDVRSAIGSDDVDKIATVSGIDSDLAANGIAEMLPGVVDRLTPDAEIPDDATILDKIGGFLTDWGATIGGAVGGSVATTAALASDATGMVGDAAEATYDKGKELISDGIGAVKSIGTANGSPADSGSGLNWLLLLIPLLIMVALSYFACGDQKPHSKDTGKPDKPITKPATNAADGSFSIKAVDGKYSVSGIVTDEATKKNIEDTLTAQFGAGNVNFDGLKIDGNAKPLATGWWDNFSKLLPDLKDWRSGSLSFAGNAITDATGLPDAAMSKLKSLFSGWTMPAALTAADAADAGRTLTELVMPDGTKLQAYPGGIEDQLVKFVSSDDFKSATAESIKDKWFNFDDLTFKFGSTELEESSKRQLDNIVAILKAFPDLKIKVGAYTDKKGDDAANLKLSDGRAKAVKAALEKAGVGAQVPEAEGYGEKFATIDENASDDARKVDRKTAIRLIK